MFLVPPKETIKYIELELLRRFIYEWDEVFRVDCGVRVTIVDQLSTIANVIAKC